MIEQACNDKIITHHDLMDLGLYIQHKEIKEQAQSIEKITNQIHKYIKRQNTSLTVSPINYIEQPHLN